MDDAIQKFTMILLRLPDGRVAVQRRTRDAPYGAGKLGMFGGWVEAGETPDKCALRELTEETSLSVEAGQLDYVADFIIRADDDFYMDRHFYLYELAITDLGFDVYEGDGAEVFSIDELQQNTELIRAAEYAFQHVIPAAGGIESPPASSELNSLGVA